MTRYITLGDACASESRYRLIGRWAKVPRTIDLAKPGPKRDLDYDHPWAFAMGKGLKTPRKKDLEKYFENMRLWFDADPKDAAACLKAGEALRCRFLVPTLPAENPTPEKLSAPLIPNWIEDMEKPDDKNRENPTPFDLAEEMSEIGAGL
jgi:hypothetical protein